MTMMINTLDGGQIETGFWGPDVSKIQLGELPLMTTQQFAGYAAVALTEGVIPKLDAQTKTEWAGHARYMRERVEDLPVMNTTGKFFAQSSAELRTQVDTVDKADENELFADIAAATARTDEAVYYKENPFTVQPDGQRVGFVHENEVQHVVDKEDFFRLTYRVVIGGLKGWGRHGEGTYQEVKDAAVQIDTALAS